VAVSLYDYTPLSLSPVWVDTITLVLAISRKINYVLKTYCTRVGNGPFPTELLDSYGDQLQVIGKEYGTTTGRRRKVNWLNMDKLIEAIRVGGATHLVINKCDILKQVGIYKVFHEGKLIDFKTFDELQDFIDFVCYNSSDLLEYIYFSGNPETIEEFQV
jgi:adenylosuccinate synthase